jgi:hypothetical protein
MANSYIQSLKSAGEKSTSSGSNPYIKSIEPTTPTPTPTQSIVEKSVEKAKPLIEKAKPIAKSLFEQGKAIVQAIPGFVISKAKQVKKEPVEVARGMGKGIITEVAEPIAKQIQKTIFGTPSIGIGVVGTDIGVGVKPNKGVIPERWDVSKQVKAFKELDEMRLEEKGVDAKGANEVGEFITSFLPYVYATEIVSATIGARILTPLASKFAPKVIKFIPQINNAIGFTGIGQLEYDKEVDGSRVERLKNDVIMLALFETGGVVLKGVTKATSAVVSKAVNSVKTKLRSGKPVPIEELEKVVTEAKVAIEKDTGKPAPLTLAENIVKTEFKETPATTEGLKLVESAIASGDDDAARALYNDLPKGGYLPSFESLKAGAKVEVERDAAKLANDGVTAVKESYGANSEIVQKMKNLLRISAEKKNAEGTLFREHIPKNVFGKSSDEIATSMGITENEFMQKITGELSTTKVPVPKAVKEIEVPGSKLPVGTGEAKASKLEARMKGVIGEATDEEIEALGLSTSNTAYNKQQLTDAAQYVTNNLDDALKVIEGKIPPPRGLLENSVFVALTQEAKTNLELAIKLAGLASKRHGQEIQILSQIDKNNPVRLLNEVYKIREEVTMKKYGGRSVKEVSDKIVKDIKTKVKVPNKYDWDNFIRSIECK